MFRLDLGFPKALIQTVFIRSFLLCKQEFRKLPKRQCNCASIGMSSHIYGAVGYNEWKRLDLLSAQEVLAVA